jgi:hypothetical protein
MTGEDAETMQALLDAGLNAFAVQLLVESFQTPGLRAYAANQPITFTLEGVEVTLRVVAEPTHPRLRRGLGLSLQEAADAR